MKKRNSPIQILLFVNLISAILIPIGCTTQPTLPPPTATAETATVIGRIVLGYGDHSPVPNLPLWIGKESIGQPVTYTNENGEFTLPDLPVGQVVDIVDDHLYFQVSIHTSGIIDLGTIEYPLIHP